MSEDYAFAKKIVEDFSGMGYATKVDDTTLRSLDGETTLEFDVELIPVNGNARTNHRVLHIFSNGDEVFSETYELARGEEVDHEGNKVLDELTLAGKVVEVVASELNF